MLVYKHHKLLKKEYGDAVLVINGRGHFPNALMQKSRFSLENLFVCV